MNTSPRFYQSGYLRTLKFSLLLLLFTFRAGYAQKDLPDNFSPGGLLEKVKDNYGNSYTLRELEVGASQRNSRNAEARSLMLCSSGYFDLYFETGSGMEGSSAVEAARRAVICQVFQDISSFINSPLTSSGNKVNIWVRDIGVIEPAPSSSNVLGLASPFYNVPYNTAPGFGGIADNEIWKTIHSGTDSYTNVITPLNTVGGTSGSFYHGMVAINFSNPSFVWHTDLTIASAPFGQKDLYTVLLHEVTHALGFASLIDFNGLSKFGTGYNYYSRYDLFLHNNAGTQHLITNTGACSLYNYQFNPSVPVTAVTPGACSSGGSLDITLAGDAARYVGTSSVPVYTPNCFEPPSSLSHFEDQLYAAAVPPFGNNQYFVMSNAGGGVTKRYLKTEERNALCDLGYNVNPTFGSAANNNFYNYASGTCPGIMVAGINDGLTSGSYNFTGAPSVPISITGLLSNDYFGTGTVPPTATFECLEDVFFPGSTTLSATSGTNSTIISFTSSVGGLHLLRYIPVYGGVRGNITYVYVYVTNTSCTPSACNIINNGSYESNLGCSGGGGGLNCWDVLIATPDVITRTCSSSPAITLPSYPNPDTHNGTPNDAYIGLAGNGAGAGKNVEGLQTQLNSPLLPGQSYILSFWAYTSPVSAFVYLDGRLQFTSYPTLTAPLLSPITTSLTSMIPGAIDIAPVITVPQDNAWHYFSIPFTFTGTTPHSMVGMWNNPLGYPYPSFLTYCYVDDVSIQPMATATTLDLPATLCINQSIADLNIHLSSAFPGGVFAGPGVSVSGGIYSFDPSVAGTGTHTITYSYTDGMGCSILIADIVTVSGSSLTVSAVASPVTAVCAGTPVTLTASGATTYVWEPGTISSNPLTVSPAATTLYTVTGTDANGCVATASVTVNVTLPPVTISTLSTGICSGSSATLTPAGAATYTLNPGGLTSPPFVVSPTSNTTYILTGTDAGGCTASASVDISVVACVCSTCTLVGSSGAMSTTTLPSGVYCINNDITITGNVMVFSSEIKMAPGTKITISPTGTLSLLSSHMYSCSDMWQGIVVQNGGKFNALSSMIEDAVVALDITNNTQTSTVLNLQSSTFNRNKVSININNYTQAIATYPFTIDGCIFTCRSIPFTVNSKIFPSAGIIGAAATNPLAPLDNPVINNATYLETGVNAMLKAPHTGNKPDAGLRLQDVGLTLNAGTSSPTYYEFLLGKTGSTVIFDNLTTGVDLINSNFKTVNTIYQNTVPALSAPSTSGAGIKAVSDAAHNNRLQVVPASGTTAANKFIDCNRAINTLNYFEHNITYNDFRSSQNNTAPVYVANQRGEFGIYVQTNRYRLCNITNNSLYNFENGITLMANFGSYNVTGVPVITGQYAGHVFVDYNTIRPHLPSYAVTTQYVANAIALQNVIGSGLQFATGFTPLIQAANNNIVSAYRGINYINWKNQNTTINTNSITLVSDPYSTTATQYGINEDNCWAYSSSGNAIRNNTITGFGITNSSKKGITSNICSKGFVSCNTTNNIYNGIEFKGLNTPCTFNKNTMSNSQYGYVLNVSGIIGPQGVASPPSPQDNQWQGSWPAGKYKTATLGSAAVSSPLYLRTTGTSVFNPHGSGYTTGTYGTHDYHLAGTSTSLFGVTGTPPLMVSCVSYTATPGSGGGGSLPALVSMLEAIAQNTIVYPSYSTASAIIDRNHLYRLLKDEPGLMAQSQILQAFFTASQTSTRETFDQIEQKLTNDDLAGAISLQAGITPVNNIEANYKEFYRLAIRNTQGSLQDSDMQALLQLANKCPFTDGVVVYQARALVNASRRSYQLFEDNCREERGDGRRLTAPGENNFDVVLFPNPGAANFSLATFGLTEGMLDLTVTDINGKIVYRQTHEVAEALTSFELEAANGVYFVKIVNSATKESVIKKLVIQK